jgi:hypothetical protein
MAKVRASLPEPSGIGFFLSLLAICVLIAANSVITSIVFAVFRDTNRWLANPRFGQPFLFFGPLLLLVVQLWLASLFWGFLRRRRSAEPQ